MLSEGFQIYLQNTFIPLKMVINMKALTIDLKVLLFVTPMGLSCMYIVLFCQVSCVSKYSINCS